jgi:hypothetical protein
MVVASSACTSRNPRPDDRSTHRDVRWTTWFQVFSALPLTTFRQRPSPPIGLETLPSGDVDIFNNATRSPRHAFTIPRRREAPDVTPSICSHSAAPHRGDRCRTSQATAAEGASGWRDPGLNGGGNSPRNHGPLGSTPIQTQARFPSQWDPHAAQPGRHLLPLLTVSASFQVRGRHEP